MGIGGIVLLRQLLIAGRHAHDRLSELVWCGGWTIPLVVLGLAISLQFWRNMAGEAEQTIAQQIDYEDSALCLKFGFATGTEQHFSCKLDLLDLRRSHETLVTATAIP